MSNFNVYSDISCFLDKTKDKNITFCVANNAISDMVKNLMISAKLNKVKIVLFALDLEIVDSCKDYCDIVIYFDNNKDVVANNFYRFGTSEFRHVVFQRFFIGNQILKKNKSYIYLDTDIVITKDFVDDILNNFKNTTYDCITQFNGQRSNTGIVSMIPNEKTISIDYDFFKKHDYLNRKKFGHDQNFFNRIILNENKVFKKKILNVKWLDRTKYPNGKWYYENTKKVENNCLLIHFNCLYGYTTKIEKMKKHNKWYL